MASNDAEPIHRVRVDGLWIDETVVTNEQFAKFVAATGYVTIAERTPTKEECFAAGIRIGADQRMMCADGLANVGDLLVAFTQMACAVARSVMHRDLSLRRLLQFSGQGLEGRKHVGEIGIAARLRAWNLERVQHRGFGRHIDIGHIRVPHRLAVAEVADRSARLDYVRDHVELGMLLEERRAVGIWSRRIELAEIPAERDQLRVGERLAVEDEDKALAPCALDRGDIAGRDGSREIDP